MNKKIYSIIAIFAIIAFTGCARMIAPPYTNVEKVSSVKIGMNLQQVNSQLGIEPYDLYFKGDDHFVVIYNYRIKDRIMKVPGDFNTDTHTAYSQTDGKDWYGKNYVCYVHFMDKKVKSIITDEGKKKSENILIKNNNLYLIQKEQIGFYNNNDTIVFVRMK